MPCYFNPQSDGLATVTCKGGNSDLFVQRCEYLKMIHDSPFPSRQSDVN